MPGLGQWANEKSFTILDEDIYTGTIKSAKLDTDEGGSPKLDKYEKYRLIVKVEIDGQADDDGNPVELRRSLAVSYGLNTKTNRWADLAKLIEITQGIKCGDPAQRDVEAEAFRGKRIRIKTINVDKDSKTFTNIESFLPSERPSLARQQPPPRGLAPRPPVEVPDEESWPDESDEIQF